MTTFSELGLTEPIERALADERYATPTPIQTEAIPHVLSGRDLIGIAQTGTGKTAAFALPILHHLSTKQRRADRKACRVLVLSPTRELSGQIVDSFNTYGRYLKPNVTLVIGGVPMGRQVRALAGGVDVLVATPGRLLDLVRSNAVRLDQVEILVLDEADRMLDMGFINDIRAIVAKLPRTRQSLLFSATMPREIAELAGQLLRDPIRVAVTPAASTSTLVEQRVVHLERADKARTLAEVLRQESVDRALVFTRTKHGADKLVRSLSKSGLNAQAIHGNKSQNQRERVLSEFREGRIRVLIATDIAARGIDVSGISHVVNYDVPNVPETYVHRIGRTARAGAAGIAISLCDAEERPFLRAIEKLIGLSIASSGLVVGAPVARGANGAGIEQRRHRPDHHAAGRPNRHHTRPERSSEPSSDRPNGHNAHTERSPDTAGPKDLAGVAFLRPPGASRNERNGNGPARAANNGKRGRYKGAHRG